MYGVILHYNTKDINTLMGSKMLNLLKHHRIHVPNGLAIFAAILLLVSTTVGYQANQDLQTPDQQTITSVNIDTSDSDVAADVAQKKRRGLNLGLLLFRR